MEKLLQEIALEDLVGFSEDTNMLAKTLGIDAFRKLVAAYSGCQIYVPHMKTITRAIRDKHIIREFDGYNSKELSRKYGLCTRQIERLIVDSRKSAQL